MKSYRSKFKVIKIHIFKNSPFLIVILHFALLTFNLSPKDAHAYIDPGTGSYIIQVILAAILGGAVTMKVFWKKIGAFLKRLFSKKGDV